jgi:hypothetical protein
MPHRQQLQTTDDSYHHQQQNHYWLCLIVAKAHNIIHTSCDCWCCRNHFPVHTCDRSGSVAFHITDCRSTNYNFTDLFSRFFQKSIQNIIFTQFQIHIIENCFLKTDKRHFHPIRSTSSQPLQCVTSFCICYNSLKMFLTGVGSIIVTPGSDSLFIPVTFPFIPDVVTCEKTVNPVRKTIKTDINSLFVLIITFI